MLVRFFDDPTAGIVPGLTILSHQLADRDARFVNRAYALVDPCLDFPRPSLGRTFRSKRLCCTLVPLPADLSPPAIANLDD
nr:hypothetical protein [Burkholderia gladioli]